MNFAIVGATGNVGRKTIEILEKSKLRINNLFLVASSLPIQTLSDWTSAPKLGFLRPCSLAPKKQFWLLLGPPVAGSNAAGASMV